MPGDKRSLANSSLPVARATSSSSLFGILFSLETSWRFASRSRSTFRQRKLMHPDREEEPVLYNQNVARQFNMMKIPLLATVRRQWREGNPRTHPMPRAIVMPYNASWLLGALAP
jgi:hypothetical protein